MADDIFNADELTAEKTGSDVVLAEETQEQKDQRERDEQGRFKAKEETPGALTPEAEAAKAGNGTVPQGALHAEREKRKASEEREKLKDAELAKAREQLDAIAKMREQIANRQPDALPAADDPAAVEHLRSELAKLQQGQNRIGQHLDEQALNNAEVQQLGSVMAQSEAEYRTTQTDYDDAINHVVQARARELALYGLTPPQIQQTIAEEAMEIVRSAVQQGRNPAELGYQIALSRGYRPAEGQQQAQQQEGGAAGKVAALSTAIGASRSLGQAAGTTPQQLNAEAIAAMSGEEFEALYSTPEGRRMIDNL